jgi:hypothetical protein
VGFVWPSLKQRRVFYRYLRLAKENAGWLLGQNISYDLMYLRTDPVLRGKLLRYFGQQVEDCMLWNFLHSEMRPERSLKSLSTLFDIAKYKENNFDAQAPYDPQLLAYNALDTRATLRARRLLREAIARDYGPETPKLSDVCRHHCSDLIWTVTALSETGLPYDVQKLQRINDDRLTVVAFLEAHLKESCGLIVRGPGSGKSQDAFVEQAAEEAWLLDDSDLLLTEKERKISTKEVNLHLIRNHLPPDSPTRHALDCLLKSRKARKIEDTYTRPLLSSPKKGIVHRLTLPSSDPKHVGGSLSVGLTYPSWYPCPSKHDLEDKEGGTIQVRITARYPACQTNPRVIKECECSRFPGGVVLEADYSQIELRIAGLLSGDPAFMEIYEKGWDVHLISGDDLAHTCLGKPKGWLYDQYREVGKSSEPVATWRQMGKTANFLVVYEGKAFKLCATVREDTGYEISQPAAQAFIEAYNARHQQLRRWQQELVAEAIRTGYIQLPFGWSRLFLGGRDAVEADRATVVNFPVQATAALLLESAQARVIEELDRRGLRSVSDKNTYDSIRVDCLPAEKPAVLSILDRWLTRPPLLEYLEDYLGRSVPIEYEVKET